MPGYGQHQRYAESTRRTLCIHPETCPARVFYNQDWLRSTCGRDNVERPTHRGRGRRTPRGRPCSSWRGARTRILRAVWRFFRRACGSSCRNDSRGADMDASVACARSEGFWTTPRRALLIGPHPCPLLMDSALGTCGRWKWTQSLAALRVRDQKAPGRRREVLC